MVYNNATNTFERNRNVTTTAVSYTALQTDDIIEVTSTAAARTITLPAPALTGATTSVGKAYTIKDTSGGAATNNITISPASGTIDGAASLTISTNYGALVVYSDGSNYFSLSSASSGGGLTWNNTTANLTMVPNNGYVITSGALNLALPAVSAFGTSLAILLQGGTSFSITQAAGQSIRIGNSTTTTGATGSLSSSAQGDAVQLVCTTANLTWTVQMGSQGNLLAQ